MRVAGICGSCSAAHLDEVGQACSVCGESGENFRETQVAQPLGFRSSYWASDYTGNRGARSFATRPRLAVARGLETSEEGNVRFSFGKATLVSVNDNNGREFRFAEFADADIKNGRLKDGLLSLDVIEDHGLAARAGMSQLARLSPSREIQVSLGAIRTSDVLRLSAARIPAAAHLDVVRNVAAKAAWLSVAFLLRNAAVRRLDVGSGELVTEVSPLADAAGHVVGEVFLADHLENGADYATWLGKHLGELMEAAVAVTDDFHAGGVNAPCDGSCYECLRNYSNAAYHPLLDWWLGREVLGVLLGRDLDLASDPWASAVEKFQDVFGWEVADQDGGCRLLRASAGTHELSLLVIHPLADATSVGRGRMKEAVRSSSAGVVQVTSGWELARRPGLVEVRARNSSLPMLSV